MAASALARSKGPINGRNGSFSSSSPNQSKRNEHCHAMFTKPRKRKSDRTCSTSDVLHLMDALRLPVPTEMYTSLVKELTLDAHASEAHHLSLHITQQQPSVSLLNRLLLMHVSHGRFDVARQLFDEMPVRDFKSWAIIVVEYANRGEFRESLGFFLEMFHHVDVLELPGWFAVCVLKTCVYTGNMDFGKQVHACSLKLGHGGNLPLASCLIDFYGRFGCHEDADFVFNQLPRHNLQTYMARLINRSREQRFPDVLRDFKEIGEAGFKKNTSMISIVLRACARIHDGGQSGRQVHAVAVKLGLVSDAFVHCGLVDMYGRAGFVGDAKRVLDINSDRSNNACWNAMLGSYVRSALYMEAMKFVYEMKAANVDIQQSLLDELIVACGSNSLSQLLPVNNR